MTIDLKDCGESFTEKKKEFWVGCLFQTRFFLKGSQDQQKKIVQGKNHFHSILRKNTTINVGSQQKPCLLSSEGNIGFCEGRNYQAGSGSKVILI